MKDMHTDTFRLLLHCTTCAVNLMPAHCRICETTVIVHFVFMRNYSNCPFRFYAQ